MAQATGDSRWLKWGLEWHRKLSIILHTNLVDLLEQFSSADDEAFEKILASYIDTMEEKLNAETFRNDDRIRRLLDLKTGGNK